MTRTEKGVFAAIVVAGFVLIVNYVQCSAKIKEMTTPKVPAAFNEGDVVEMVMGGRKAQVYGTYYVKHWYYKVRFEDGKTDTVRDFEIQREIQHDKEKQE